MHCGGVSGVQDGLGRTSAARTDYHIEQVTNQHPDVNPEMICKMVDTDVGPVERRYDP